MASIQDSVWLNGVKMPLVDSVVWDVAPPFPPQIIDSEPTEENFLPVSKQTWSDLRGGGGVEKWSPKKNNRFWEATDVDTSRTTQTLGPLVTTLGSFGAAPMKIIKHRDQIWAIGHNAISVWTGSAWSSKKTDFSNPTDAILFYGASS